MCHKDIFFLGLMEICMHRCLFVHYIKVLSKNLLELLKKEIQIFSFC